MRWPGPVDDLLVCFDMLLNGFNHVAILTNDSDRLHAFYREVFDATVHDLPAFGRGRIDHLALQAGSLEAFDTIRDYHGEG